MYGYNQYYPTQYGQYNAPQKAQQQGGINWVQGVSGAKAYVVEPNSSVFLMDSESSVFYIKSADASGMPLPLRVFDYKERSADQIQETQANNLQDTFVTRQEYNAMLQKLETMRKRMQQAPAQSLSIEEGNTDAESFI